MADTNIWDHRAMFERYLYDYLRKKNMHQAAETFKEETNLKIDPANPKSIDIPGGFLHEWWSLFSDIFSARQLKNIECNKDPSIVVEPMMKTSPQDLALLGQNEMSEQTPSHLAGSACHGFTTGNSLFPSMGQPFNEIPEGLQTSLYEQEISNLIAQGAGSSVDAELRMENVAPDKVEQMMKTSVQNLALSGQYEMNEETLRHLAGSDGHGLTMRNYLHPSMGLPFTEIPQGLSSSQYRQEPLGIASSSGILYPPGNLPNLIGRERSSVHPALRMENIAPDEVEQMMKTSAQNLALSGQYGMNEQTLRHLAGSAGHGLTTGNNLLPSMGRPFLEIDKGLSASQYGQMLDDLIGQGVASSVHEELRMKNVAHDEVVEIIVIPSDSEDERRNMPGFTNFPTEVSSSIPESLKVHEVEEILKEWYNN